MARPAAALLTGPEVTCYDAVVIDPASPYSSSVPFGRDEKSALDAALRDFLAFVPPGPLKEEYFVENESF